MTSITATKLWRSLQGNAYGSLVLNSENTLFADLDYQQPEKPSLGELYRQSSGIKDFFAKLFGKNPDLYKKAR